MHCTLKPKTFSNLQRSVTYNHLLNKNKTVYQLCATFPNCR